jgi:hypothetical protein
MIAFLARISAAPSHAPLRFGGGFGQRILGDRTPPPIDHPPRIGA